MAVVDKQRWRNGRWRSGRWLPAAAVGAAALVGAIVAGILLATGGDSTEETALPAGVDPWDAVTVDADAAYLPTIANADLAVGSNRLTFVVQDREGFSASDLEIRTSLYDLSGDRTRPVREEDAEFIDFGAESPVPEAHTHAEGGELSDAALYIRGAYVVPAAFDHAGEWGIEFAIRPAGSTAEPTLVRFRFSVREHSAAPAVGEPAPRSRTRTLADEPEIRNLTSDPTPEPGLYQLSIDEALDQQRPLIVAFATPAYCHSRTCGPTVDVVKAVWREYAGDVNAIHVEVFENPHEPEALRESAAFREWHLPSEPWVFVIGGDGRIAARFEGTVTAHELREAVEAALTP